MSTARRKPKCHKCGNFMAGHRRLHGAPICPPDYDDASSVATSERSLISPPLTPDRERNSLEGSTESKIRPSPPPNRRLQRYSSPLADSPLELNPLPGGAWHRRNPNWNEGSAYDITRFTSPSALPKQYVGLRPSREPSPAASMVPTELVEDDRITIREDMSVHTFPMDDSDNEHAFDWDDGASTASSVSTASSGSSSTIHGHRRDSGDYYPYHPSKSWVSRLASFARNDRGAVTIFRAKPKELAKIERTAMKHGVFAATMEPSFEDDNFGPSSSKAMVVLGKSASFVHQIANGGYSMERSYRENNRRQVTMQGTMQGTMPASNSTGGNAWMVLFFQLLLASILGGCFVMYGMSYLAKATSTATQS